ncbi:MAG TPA: CPBP family intramembrane glutamic endopeptidase [Spongiibacteraceae bacterium]|nr:CPBP family intramembrane glutamic endopeptidase [Spongiibacteraceae bacterium]
MTSEEVQLIMLAASQVFYAISVVLALFIIDTGRRTWVPYLATVIIIGLLGFTATGFVAYPTTIVAMIVFTLVATIYSTQKEFWKRQIRYGGMLLGLLAGFHQVHGIETVPLYSKWWEYGSKLLAFDFPIDKAYAGLLLALIAAQFHPQKRNWRNIWLVPVGVGGFLLLVYLLGHPIQYTVPKYAAAFLFVNLMETCFAEELFFRGALQRELMLYLAPIPAIVIAAILFGLVHVFRGWEFVMLATISGVLHGFVYRRTGVLSLSVLSHFCVNVAWIALFPSVGH